MNSNPEAKAGPRTMKTKTFAILATSVGMLATVAIAVYSLAFTVNINAASERTIDVRIHFNDRFSNVLEPGALDLPVEIHNGTYKHYIDYILYIDSVPFETGATWGVRLLIPKYRIVGAYGSLCTITLNSSSSVDFTWEYLDGSLEPSSLNLMFDIYVEYDSEYNPSFDPEPEPICQCPCVGC